MVLCYAVLVLIVLQRDQGPYYRTGLPLRYIADFGWSCLLTSRRRLTTVRDFARKYKHLPVKKSHRYSTGFECHRARNVQQCGRTM